MALDPETSPMSYRLLRHPRARRLRLRVECDGSLVVTAPKHLRHSEIDRFVAARKDWIRAVRERLARARAGRDPAIFSLRPARIDLPAVGETWRVVHGQASGELCGQGPDTAELLLQLPANEPIEAVVWQLHGWLKNRARHALTPRIQALAQAHGMTYGRLSFRNQKSRWGSCSSKGNLSLNARLLFCSPEACRYVLIHELVHLEHPNHSPDFWQRVAELCPDYRRHMRELKTVWHRLPDWVTAS